MHGHFTMTTSPIDPPPFAPFAPAGGASSPALPPVATVYDAADALTTIEHLCRCADGEFVRCALRDLREVA